MKLTRRSFLAAVASLFATSASAQVGLSQLSAPQDLYHTTWSPATCGCTLRYWLSERDMNDPRIPVPFDAPGVTVRCSRHASLINPNDHYRVVLAEHCAISRLMPRKKIV